MRAIGVATERRRLERDEVGAAVEGLVGDPAGDGVAEAVAACRVRARRPRRRSRSARRRARSTSARRDDRAVVGLGERDRDVVGEQRVGIGERRLEPVRGDREVRERLARDGGVRGDVGGGLGQPHPNAGGIGARLEARLRRPSPGGPSSRAKPRAVSTSVMSSSAPTRAKTQAVWPSAKRNASVASAQAVAIGAVGADRGPVRPASRARRVTATMPSASRMPAGVERVGATGGSRTGCGGLGRRGSARAWMLRSLAANRTPKTSGLDTLVSRRGNGRQPAGRGDPREAQAARPRAARVASRPSRHRGEPHADQGRRRQRADPAQDRGHRRDQGRGSSAPTPPCSPSTAA